MQNHKHGILSYIYKGDPNNKYHYFVGFDKKRLVVLGGYKTIVQASACSSFFTGIIIHSNLKDIQKVTNEIRHRIKHVEELRHDS